MLSMEIMLEMGRRVQPSGFWTKQTANFARQAAQEAKYCLDAPDEIPAGGMRCEQIDADWSAPIPISINREPQEG